MKKDTRKSGDEAGSYLPNRFLMEFAEDEPVIVELPDEAPDFDRDLWPLFAHEYWHYWHNVSTTSSFRSFILSRHLLESYTKTLSDYAKVSRGSDALSPAEKEFFENSLRLKEALQGDAEPADWDSTLDEDMASIRLVDKTFVDDPIRLKGRDCRLESVTLHFEVLDDSEQVIGRVEMALGEVAIDESIALLIERQVALEVDDEFDEDDVPPFPYRVLEYVYDGIVGAPCEDRRVLASLGTLSLLSTAPGVTLIHLLERMKIELATSDTEAIAYEKVEDRFRKQFIEKIDEYINSDPELLLGAEQGRGLVEPAVASFLCLLRRALARRKDDLTFGLGFFFPSFSEAEFEAFYDEFRPCNVLQRHPSGNDGLYSFFDPASDAGEDPTLFIRSLHAQQHLVASHLDDVAVEIIETSDADGCCPYVICCDHPLRASRGTDCATQPWVLAEATPLCWYGTAALTTRGPVQFRTIPREEPPPPAGGPPPVL